MPADRPISRDLIAPLAARIVPRMPNEEPALTCLNASSLIALAASPSASGRLHEIAATGNKQALRKAIGNPAIAGTELLPVLQEAAESGDAEILGFGMRRTDIPVANRLPLAAASRSPHVRRAFFRTLTPADITKMSESDNSAVRKLISEQIINAAR